MDGGAVAALLLGALLPSLPSGGRVAWLLAVALALVGLLLPGELWRPARGSASDARWWAEACLRASRAAAFGAASGVYPLLALESVGADGTIRARLRLGPALQNVMHSLHGGAAAMVVDELTTASVASQRSFPGVSVSLSLEFVAGCAPGELIAVTSRLTRLGPRGAPPGVRTRSPGAGVSAAADSFRARAACRGGAPPARCPAPFPARPQGRTLAHAEVEFRRADGAVMLRARRHAHPLLSAPTCLA